MDLWIQKHPPEALPAYENDQNYYVVTARSQFLHSKLLQKKRSIYFGNDNPSMTSASKRATATFSHIFIFEDCAPGPFSMANFQGWFVWGPSRIHLRDPCGSWLSPCSSGFWCDKRCLGPSRLPVCAFLGLLSSVFHNNTRKKNSGRHYLLHLFKWHKAWKYWSTGVSQTHTHTGLKTLLWQNLLFIVALVWFCSYASAGYSFWINCHTLPRSCLSFASFLLLRLSSSLPQAWEYLYNTTFIFIYI